jgi:hypothetical protein
VDKNVDIVNGGIDDGRELFGSSTFQPYPAEGETKNGFRALAVYDKSAQDRKL